VAELPVTLNWARLHKNKLKPGHLLGNRFRITITDLATTEAETQRRVNAIAEQLQRTGIANFFGPQRLGSEGANVRKGRQIVVEHRQVQDRWLRRFLISSYQSYLCNRYLAQRMEMGAFDHLLAGDIAKKYDTGGMFEVEDPATEQARYAAHEISFTAPLYGPKLWAASGAAGELESAILAEAGVTLEDFRRVKVEGSRRLGRLLVPDLRTQSLENALIIEFFLPKGAFATTVLREFMKIDLLATSEFGPEFDGDDGS
jgi:tRNA pseudouridine13 synthase